MMCKVSSNTIIVILLIAVEIASPFTPIFHKAPSRNSAPLPDSTGDTTGDTTAGRRTDGISIRTCTSRIFATQSTSKFVVHDNNANTKEKVVQQENEEDHTALAVDSNSILTRSSDSESNATVTLNTTQEENLDAILKETLFRMSFFMDSDYLIRTENIALRSLFQTCIDSVYVKESTIPKAGRGLFAQREIPKGTIVAIYPVHLIGFKLGSGLCNSVQLANNQSDMIDVERSSYAIFSLLNRNLCGINLQKAFDNDGRLFIDMNPCNTLNVGWYCGLINDAATVQCHGDLNYYPKSRSAQNVEIVPFSCAPFQVAVTKKDIKIGEELFVSYGYSYWYNSFVVSTNDESDYGHCWEPKPEAIIEQEDMAASEMYAIVDETEEKYKEASWVLEYVFNKMNSETPPPEVLPKYTIRSITSSSTGTSTGRNSPSKRKRVMSIIDEVKRQLKQKWKKSKILS